MRGLVTVTNVISSLASLAMIWLGARIAYWGLLGFEHGDYSGTARGIALAAAYVIIITILGQWMYEPEAVTGMVGLIRGGLLDLDHCAVTEFILADANAAVTHAAANVGPFKLTVLRPAA